jgi:hypothetical protein
MSSVVRQIAELETLPAAQLEDRWRALFGTDPPTYQRRFLVKRLAYRIQELAYGGLSEATRARMEEIAQEAGFDEEASLPGRGRRATGRKRDLPVAGTRLVREWNGRRYEVTVTTTGLQFEGRPYRSLSAIANAITNGHWNGRVFFGLRDGPKETSR